MEVAYRIPKDYNEIETSEVYLEEFTDRFLEDYGPGTTLEIAPGQIEEWLDKELDAPEEMMTGEKRDYDN